MFSRIVPATWSRASGPSREQRWTYLLQPVKSGAPPNPPAAPAGPADATDATITDTPGASRPSQTPVPQPHGATRIAYKPPHPRAVTRCFIRLAHLWMAIDEHQSRERDALGAAAQLRDTFLRATTLTLALWPLTCQKPLQETFFLSSGEWLTCSS